ncbi:MAG: DUF1549 domain-containing protein [Planctomycetes bacterium]|nr:DUF1549 domain-containing protein [Planctomycetota bacterium]
MNRAFEFHVTLRRPFALRIIATVLTVLLSNSIVRSAEPEDIRFFREKIEPVLKSECYGCHSRTNKVQGGLLLDSRSGMLRGGESGPAVKPGKVAESLLIQALRHEGGLAMPPKKAKVAESTVADFVQWIEQGAAAPGSEAVAESDPSGVKAARGHWAFQPLQPVVPPAVHESSWPDSPVDAFVLARLEQESLQHAAPASRHEWIRRVTFDLTGLPPEPDEIDDFVRDESPDACERLVDRLLGSWQYGERWAQHWLDVVRFAETEGYEYDRTVPDAWRYRDYVISSLNRDKPFDRFITEQLAGDELEPDNTECLTATIFHRLGPVRRNAGNPEIALSRNEVLTERTDILGAALLGLTVGCARCHNHKLEPITQKDYYQLQAYLAAMDEHNILLADAAAQQEWEAETRRLKDQMAALQKRARLLTGEERIRLTEMIEQLEDQLPAPLATIPGTHNDFSKRTPIHVLRRGVWDNKGELVGPRPPSVLVPDDYSELPPETSAPRSQLAAWLVRPDQALPLRVYVNRLWQNHFGLGLVKTANDFGLKGDRPRHPELLEWLTASFLRNGMQSKPLHRAIVLSSTYRQSNRPTDARANRVDPENRLLSHFSRRRLSADELRDAMLAVAGRLNRQDGGRSVIIPVDQELVQLLYKPSQWQVTPDVRQHDRRSIYLMAKRNLRLPFMENLDAPTLQSSCARRDTSTHAPQALELLNGSVSNGLARSFSDRLQLEAGQDLERVVNMAFLRALGRPATTIERQKSLEFLRDEPPTEFALALFNLNEFLYVP